MGELDAGTINNKTPNILNKIWVFYFLIVFLLVFLVLYPLFYFLLRKPERYPKAHALRRFWGRSIMFLGGLRGKIEYEEPLDPAKTYIFVANHSSYLDIVGMTVMIPYYFNFMAKMELSKIPLFGIFFRTIDIAVDRKNPVSSHKAFLKASNQLKNGQCITLFPEGTISKSAPRLSKFKVGAFRMAIENGIEVVPVTMPDNWKRLPDNGSFTGSPGVMRMFVHKPLPTAHLQVDQNEELKLSVYSIIENKLHQFINE